jgi:hypothetical protein
VKPIATKSTWYDAYHTMWLCLISNTLTDSLSLSLSDSQPPITSTPIPNVGVSIQLSHLVQLLQERDALRQSVLEAEVCSYHIDPHSVCSLAPLTGYFSRRLEYTRNASDSRNGNMHNRKPSNIISISISISSLHNHCHQVLRHRHLTRLVCHTWQALSPMYMPWLTVISFVVREPCALALTHVL